MINYLLFLFYKVLYKAKIIGDAKYLKLLGAEIGNNNSFYNNRYDEGHAYLLKIGNGCTITNVTFLNHDASTKRITGKTKIGKIIIGNNVFIGMNSILLPNIKIGDNCIIGAGSVVTKSMPENSVICGNPAKVINSIDNFKEKQKQKLKNLPVFEKNWRKKRLSEKRAEANSIEGEAFDD